MMRLVHFISISVVLCGVTIFPAAPVFALEPKQCLPMAEMNAALKAEGQRTLIIGDRMDYEGQRLTVAGTTMTRAEWRNLTVQLGSDTQVRRDLIAKMRRDGKTQQEADALIAKILGVTAILEKGDPDSPIPRVMTAFAANSDGSVGYSLEGDRPSGQPSTRACIRARLTNVRLPAAGGSVLLEAQGDVQQINDTVIRGLNVSLRGTTQNAALVAVGSSRTPPLFYLAGLQFTPVGLARRGM